MMRDCVADHVLVGTDDESSVWHEQEETHRLQCMDRVFGEAPVEIVNKNDERLLKPFKHFAELSAESGDFLGRPFL